MTHSDIIRSHRRLHNTPEDYTKPQQTIQSPDRLHKALTDYTKHQKGYTQIYNMKQRFKISHMTTQPVVLHISVYVYIHTYVYCAIHIRIINIILYFQFQVLSSFLDMCASPCPARGTWGQFAFQCFLQAAVARTTPSRWLYLEKAKNSLFMFGP